jgi:hypothetical protein
MDIDHGMKVFAYNITARAIVTGAMKKVTRIASVTAALSIGAADLRVNTSFHGAIAANTTLTGDMHNKSIAGTIVSGTTAAGILDTSVGLSGTILVASVVAPPTMKTANRIRLAAKHTVDGTAVGTGALGITKTLDTTVSALSVVTDAPLKISYTLDGTSTAIPTITATLSVSHGVSLTGTIDATSGITATSLLASKAMRGVTIATVSTVISSDLDDQVRFAGTIAATSDTQGTVNTYLYDKFGQSVPWEPRGYYKLVEFEDRTLIVPPDRT